MRIDRVVDLSRPITPGMQVYPGDPLPAARQVASLDSDGFCLHELTLGSQTGTHLDAPSHTLPGAATSAMFTADALVAVGRVVDLTGIAAESLIGPGEIDATLATVGPGDAVLLRTGWDRFEGTAAAWQHPGLSLAAAAAIVARLPRFIGIDAASIDRHGEPGLPAQQVFAAAGIPILENLTALAQLDFADPLIVVGALPWAGLDGAPARVLGISLG